MSTAEHHHRIFSPAFLTATAVVVALGTLALPSQGQSNLLVNGDFETGAPGGMPQGWTGTGGWNANPNGAVHESTNGWVYTSGDTIPNPAIDVQSCKVYGDFNGNPNTMGCYQELNAGAGSIWSAAGKVYTASPDNIAPGNEVWLEISFRDASGFTLALYRSPAIDSTDLVDTWLNLPVNQEWDVFDEMFPPSSSSPFGPANSLIAPFGTVRVRSQLKFYQPLYEGGSVYFDDIELIQFTGSDPELVSTPESRTAVQGEVTVFEVTAEGTPPISYRWYKDEVGLSDFGNISGAFTDTLTVTNLVVADSGTYSVQVVGQSVRTAEANLKVVSLTDHANLLNNPGFEDGVDALPWQSAWTRFGGGVLETTNNFVFGSDDTIPVQTHAGMYVSKTWNGGTDNGLFQEVPAEAGKFYTADGWFRTAAPDNLGGSNACWLIVQFKDIGGGTIQEIRSPVLDSTMPADTWVNVVVTNAIGSRYLQAPDLTTGISYLVFFNGQPDSAGSVYYDDMRLLDKGPAELSIAPQGTQVELTFPTRLLNTYRLWSRGSLDGGTSLLQTVPGDGSVKTIPTPLGTPPSFFSVTTE